MRVSVVCGSCGEDLEAYVEQDVITVTPCDKCKEETYDEGYDDGYRAALKEKE